MCHTVKFVTGLVWRQNSLAAWVCLCVFNNVRYQTKSQYRHLFSIPLISTIALRWRGKDFLFNLPIEHARAQFQRVWVKFLCFLTPSPEWEKKNILIGKLMPTPGIEPWPSALQASVQFFTTFALGQKVNIINKTKIC